MRALSHLEEVGGAVHLKNQSQAKINTSQCYGIEGETVQGGTPLHIRIRNQPESVARCEHVNHVQSNSEFEKRWHSVDDAII